MYGVHNYIQILRYLNLVLALHDVLHDVFFHGCQILQDAYTDKIFNHCNFYIFFYNIALSEARVLIQIY